jgi:hypothetical protein
MRSPITREDYRRTGYTDAGIDTELRASRLVPVARGALLPVATADEHLARCTAALTTQRPDAAISHRSAAVALACRWHPAAWASPSEPLDVTAARDDLTRSARRGLRRRIADLPDTDVVLVGGLRVTSPARTLVDLARTEPMLLALQLMDGALRDERCTLADLIAVCDRMVRVPNVRRARQIIERARPGVDSPQETLVRRQVVDAGLPEPTPRLEIWEDGRLLAVGDLGYWQWLIWLEYDGYEFHSERGVFGSDRARDRWLARRGWESMRLTADDARYPAAYLRQLAQALTDAPARIAAMDPRRSPELAAAQALLEARRS